MAVIIIDQKESLNQGRVKTNELSQNVGDLDLLTTPVTTDLVSAINSVDASVGQQDKKMLLFAIAVSE
jgi:hypothetical protein